MAEAKTFYVYMKPAPPPTPPNENASSALMSENCPPELKEVWRDHGITDVFAGKG